MDTSLNLSSQSFFCINLATACFWEKENSILRFVALIEVIKRLLICFFAFSLAVLIMTACSSFSVWLFQKADLSKKLLNANQSVGVYMIRIFVVNGCTELFDWLIQNYKKELVLFHPITIWARFLSFSFGWAIST